MLKAYLLAPIEESQSRLCTGLLGVGGGFVMVPALRRATNLPMESIVATSLAVIALVSCAAVTSSAASGHLDSPVALPFSIGAVCGMLGRRLVARRAGGRRSRAPLHGWRLARRAPCCARPFHSTQLQGRNMTDLFENPMD